VLLAERIIIGPSHRQPGNAGLSNSPPIMPHNTVTVEQNNDTILT
jgi:hypothetical protein